MVSLHCHPHVPSCMCANRYLDGYTWINLACKFTEKVILKIEWIHFHCHPHVPSCMCVNRYLDGHPLCLLCYTGINLACKFTEKVILQLKYFTFTVILIFHPACV